MYTLSNDKLTLKISEKGAELCSIVSNDTQKEYLWCADSKYWNRHSPVLFPIVGSLKNKQYKYNDKIYDMINHGFARDNVFSLVKQSVNEIWFELKSNDEIRKVYPFDFCLKIGYLLENNYVKVMWSVINDSNDEMYFSIGAHPGFMCPVGQSSNSFEFENIDELKYKLINNNGLLIDKQYTKKLNDHMLNITPDLFDNDALIVENNQSNKVSLIDKHGNKYVTVHFDAPLFGIWSPPKKSAPFVCIEPWYGRCDSEDFEGTLQEREWSNSVKPNEAFEKFYVIEIFC